MGSNPSRFGDCDDCPVESVSWDDIQVYLQKLNAKAGNQYRLPSEAEWEYACRAGGSHTFCGSNDVDAVGWTHKNVDIKNYPVGRKQANEFGLHDMSGNVWEWVQDCWNHSYAGAPMDGSAWTSGDCGRRVLRGGSRGSHPLLVRPSVRYRFSSRDRSAYVGFRVALSSESAN
jgi:formylglycine-generating enzyme required for sulfatase activity